MHVIIDQDGPRGQADRADRLRGVAAVLIDLERDDPGGDGERLRVRGGFGPRSRRPVYDRRDGDQARRDKDGLHDPSPHEEPPQGVLEVDGRAVAPLGVRRQRLANDPLQRAVPAG